MELIWDAWGRVGSAQDFLLAIVLSIATAWVLSLFRPRVKLHWGSTSLSFHKFKLEEDGEPIVVSTEKIFLQNVGRKPASEIELVLTDIPSSYTLWSPREHESKPLKNGGFSIVIPSLAPRELLIVDIIDVDRRNPKLIAVNCPDVLAENIEFKPQRVQNKWVIALVLYLMTAGLVGTIYLGLKIFLS